MNRPLYKLTPNKVNKVSHVIRVIRSFSFVCTSQSVSMSEFEIHELNQRN